VSLYVLGLAACGPAADPDVDRLVGRWQVDVAALCGETAFARLSDAQREVMADIKQMRDADRKAMVYVGEMVQQKKLNEALLVQLTRTSRPTELIHAFARLAEVDVKTVRRLFTARNVEGVAIICRAMRFERGTFSTIALSLMGNSGNATQNVHEVLELYEQVTTEAAQRVMRFWRIRREVVDQSGKF
jgi:hypothetical protein